MVSSVTADSADFSSQINRLSQGTPRHSQEDYRSVKSSLSMTDEEEETEDVPREESNKRKSTKVSIDRVVDN
jgi:hypothetical protein